MGTNRTQPFGYRMEFGKTAIDPEESRWVVFIYEQYILGESIKSLSDRMSGMGIRYDVGKPWNKSMIARILQDRRYIGEGKYPQIIDESTFQQADEKRDKKKPENQPTKAQKILRKKCGCQVTPHLEHEVIYLLYTLAGKPERITAAARPNPNRGREEGLQSELESMLRKLPVDEEQARYKLMEATIAMYEAIDPELYKTHRLKQVFGREQARTELDCDLLEQSIASVTIDSMGKVIIQLKNGQIIERREYSERTPENRNHHTGKTQGGAGSTEAKAAGRGLLPGSYRGRRTAVKL